jgi:hypothetical protein
LRAKFMLKNLKYISIFLSVSRHFHSESPDAGQIIQTQLEFPQLKLILNAFILLNFVYEFILSLQVILKLGCKLQCRGRRATFCSLLTCSFIYSITRFSTFFFSVPLSLTKHLWVPLHTENINNVQLYIPVFSIYTDKHNNISLLLYSITVLRHVSVIQGNHHHVRIPHL